MLYQFLIFVDSTSKNVKELAEEYLWGAGWKNGSVSEEGLTSLQKQANECYQYQRVLIGNGRVEFLRDPLCSNVHKKRASQRKGKQKFAVMVQRHMESVARSCSGRLSFVDVVINLRDEPVQRSDPFSRPTAPLLSFQTRDGFLDIPMEYSVDAHDDSLRRFLDNYTSYASNNPKQTAWKQRKPVLFWRGSQTGGWYNTDNWRQYPRSKLVMFSKEYPMLSDAAFSAWTQVYPRARKRMETELGALKAFVPMHDHWRYRYLASLDGNGWANRLPFLLGLGSLVFKQDSNYSTWWYPLIKPWKHYIPISAELDNLEDRIRWARDHDTEAQTIAERGQQFIQSTLRHQVKNNEYMCHLLEAYQRLQKPDDTPPIQRIENYLSKYGKDDSMINHIK
jgi:hypothetical protein